MFKYLFFRAFAKPVGYLPTQMLRFLSGQKFIVPLFHTVSDVPLPHLKHIYEPINVAKFRKDIDFFLQNYHPTHIDKLLNGSVLQEKEPHFLLTFDDGMSELYDIVMPILQEKGVPATVFLNATFVDNKNLFYRHKVSLLIEKWQNMQPSLALQNEIQALFLAEKLPFTTFSQTLIEETQHKHIPFIDALAEKLEVDFADYLAKQKPYLSLAQIHEMQQKGFTFGAHSLSHPQYSHVSLEEQLRQTQECMEFVLRYVPNSPKVFAFPFTDFEVSKEFFNYFQQKYPLDFTFGCAGLKKKEYPTHIQRIECEKGDYSMKSIVNTEYVFYMLSALIGKNKVLR